MSEGWLLVVDVTVDPQSEEEWNRWYTEEHLPAVLDCPGFRSGRRLVSRHGGGTRYLTVYEIDGPEATESPEFSAARGWYQFATHVQASVRLFHEVAAATAPADG